VSVEVICTPGDSDPLELPKRTYVPGVVLKDTCPKCKTPWEMDLADQYLSHPIVGKPHNVGGYCHNEDCGHEWPVMVIVRLTIEAAPVKEST